MPVEGKHSEKSRSRNIALDSISFDSVYIVTHYAGRASSAANPPSVWSSYSHHLRSLVQHSVRRFIGCTAYGETSPRSSARDLHAVRNLDTSCRIGDAAMNADFGSCASNPDATSERPKSGVDNEDAMDEEDKVKSNDDTMVEEDDDGIWDENCKTVDVDHGGNSVDDNADNIVLDAIDIPYPVPLLLLFPSMGEKSGNAHQYRRHQNPEEEGRAYRRLDVWKSRCSSCHTPSCTRPPNLDHSISLEAHLELVDTQRTL